MNGNLESAMREFLKPILREVIEEVAGNQIPMSQQHAKLTPQDDRLLLRAREAAKRLAISERHLFKLTSEGEIPCVRIGRLVHYSVETIERWICETESTEAPAKQPRQQPMLSSSSKTSQKAKPERKKASKSRNFPKSKTEKTGATKGRKRPVKQAEANQEPERINPFTELMKEIGIDRDQLGPVSNGELMRIAEVELPVYHGWMYLGREMPEEALERLGSHFKKIVSEQDDEK